jgi:hypothetical protein
MITSILRTLSNKKFLIQNLVICSLAIPLPSYASTLTIKNDDNTEIEVVIQPGEGSVTGSSTEIRNKIKSKQQKKIEVDKSDIGNAEIFSVIGKVTLPSVYNRCNGLFIDKNYKIVFVASKAGGTICYKEVLD